MPQKWLQDRPKGSKTAPGMPPLRAFCGEEGTTSPTSGRLHAPPSPATPLRAWSPLSLSLSFSRSLSLHPSPPSTPKSVEGLPPESQVRIPRLTVLHVPSSLKSGNTPRAFQDPRQPLELNQFDRTVEVNFPWRVHVRRVPDEGN
jgi:hypothetical protein